MTRLQVRDVMTQPVVAVREGAPYKEIADTLATRAVSALPVLDPTDHVVGVVSEADLLHKIEFRDPKRHALLDGRRRSARQKAVGDVASDLMTSPAITILPDASIVTAARRMDADAVKRLPVVDELGRLVGIVSRRDLIRVFMRTDESIRRDVIEQVHRRTFWIVPGEAPVEVRDGIVTLAGVVERSSMIDVAVRLTQAIDGVVDVVNRLTATYDDRLERTFEAMTKGRSDA